MGIYVYTARATKTAATTYDRNGNASRVSVSHVKYAARSSDWDGYYLRLGEQNRHAARIQRREELAEEAVNQSSGLFVICGGEKDKPFPGAPVFRAAEGWRGVWFDCDRTPGDVVGFLHREGRGWTIKSYSPWSEGHLRASADRASHQWVLVETRQYLKDGEVFEETRPSYIPSNTKLGEAAYNLSGCKVGYFAGYWSEEAVNSGSLGSPDVFAVICSTKHEDDFEKAVAAANR